MTNLLRLAKTYGTTLVVLAAFIFSGAVILIRRSEEHPPGATVIRIGHWQLEPGFREALQHVIAKYEAIHPGVNIVIDSIPESTYGQWVTTQLMGGTAPDILETGGQLTKPIWISYFNRYFLSLTYLADKPNPYNAGTALEGVPYRSTFKEGLVGGYVEEMQETMRVPFCQHSVGIYYNKTLLKQLAGIDQPPEDYRRFIEVCKTIASQRNSRNQPYIAIAGQPVNWEDRLLNPLTFRVRDTADMGRDGLVSMEEIFLAFRSGILSLDNPALRKRLQMTHEVSSFFPQGYVGLKRDETVFMFVQQRAVFISAGTWEAAALRLQAEGQFELGVASFPRPAPDDPEYGQLMPGPLFESNTTLSPPFAVNRESRHPDVAVDFLLFLTSQKVNEEFNRITSWIPIIIGAETSEFMKQFEPQFKGIYSGVAAFLFAGPRTEIKWSQAYSSFQTRRREGDPKEDADRVIAELRENYEPALRGEDGLADFAEFQRNARRNTERTEHLAALLRGRALTLPEANAGGAWLKYRALVRDQQTWPDVLIPLRDAIASGRRSFPIQYKYTDEALNRVRQNQQRKMELP
jgi:ABC-type glycerol-3-phosphate transport system substrate-binding protein